MRQLIPIPILEAHAVGVRTGRFNAAVLFIDTSGFTRLTAALMAYGTEGAELIADALVTVFDPLVDAVYAHGGYVVGFAGDAFKAVFPHDNFFDTHTARREAVAAAWHIRSLMQGNTAVSTPYGNFEFVVKVAMADGPVDWTIWQSEIDEAMQQAAYVYDGPALSEAMDGDPFLAAGEVVMTTELHRALELHLAVEPVEKDQQQRFLRVLDVSARILTEAENQSGIWVNAQPATKFFPERLLHATQQGEFRDVVTLFVNVQSLPSLADAEQILFSLLDQYGGYLCRIGQIGARDQGVTFLLFWGAPQSTENDVIRALNFVLDLRDALPVPIRAGITSSRAYAGFVGGTQREEYTCHGTEVNRAARHMISAPWGEIWLDAETLRLGAEAFEIESAGEVQQKGFDAATVVYRLVARRQPLIQTFYPGTLAGRQAEVALLREQIVQPLRQQQPTMSMVLGEAGSGKSRLIHELQRELIEFAEFDEGPRWFLCQTDDIVRRPLNPFRYWLARYFEQSTAVGETRNKERFHQRIADLIMQVDDETIREELLRSQSMLGALVGLHWPGSLYETLDPKGRFENTLDALKTIIKAESCLQPIIIHIEDAHWLDADSLTFLSHLTRNIERFPIAIILAGRLEGGLPRYTNQLLKTPIQVGPLSLSAIRELASNVLEGPVSDELISLLALRADGNPYFAEQTLLYLREQKLLHWSPPCWEISEDTIGAPLPGDVRTILVTRLDRLAQDVLEVVQTASILGREFEVQVLAEMFAQDTALPAKLVAAEKAEIWHAVTQLRYLFKHILLRDTAYEMQLNARRRELHLRAAETIERLYAQELTPHIAELAYHFEKAEIHDRTRHYLQAVADAARAAYQNKTALENYRKLLKLLKTHMQFAHELIIETLIKLGELMQVELGPEQAEAAFAEAIELGESEQLVGPLAFALSGFGELLTEQGEYEKAATYQKRAIQFFEQSQQGQGHSLSLERLGRIFYLQGDYDQAHRSYQAAMEIAESAGDRIAIARCLSRIGPLYRIQGNYETALAYYERGLQVARELDDQILIARNLGNMSIVYMFTAAYEKAQSFAEEALAINRKLGDKRGVAYRLGTLGLLHYFQNRYPEAIDAHQRALQIDRELGNREGQARHIGNLGIAQFTLGHYEQAVTTYQEALAIDEALDNKRGVARHLGNIAEVYLEMGSYDLALEHYRAALDMDVAQGNRASVARQTLFIGRTYQRQNALDKAEVAFNDAFESLHELDLQRELCHGLIFMTELKMKQARWAEARRHVDEGMAIAQRLNLSDQVIFEGEVLQARLLAQSGNIIAARDLLNARRRHTVERHEIASIEYALWQISGEYGHRQAALKGYRDEYKRVPKAIYRERIRKLTNPI